MRASPDHHRWRAERERTLAAQSGDEAARAAHQALAELHEAMAADAPRPSYLAENG